MGALLVRWGVAVVAAATVVMAMAGVVTTPAAASTACTEDEELRQVVLASDGCVTGRIEDITEVEGGCEVKLHDPFKVFCIEVHKCVTPFSKALRYNNSEDCKEVIKIHNHPQNNYKSYYFFGRFLKDDRKRMSLQGIRVKTAQMKKNDITNLFTCGNAPPLQHRSACVRFPAASLLGGRLWHAQRSASRALAVHR